MVGPADIGRPAIVRAADHFYAFVDGWEGSITGVANGLATLEVEQEEGGEVVKKVFIIPADQLAAVAQ